MRKLLSGTLSALIASQVIVPGTGVAAGVDTATLPSLSNEVFAQLSRPTSLGHNLVYTGVDPTSNRVEIGVVNYTPSLAQRLQHQFGSTRIKVVPAQPFHLNVLKKRKTAAFGPQRSGGMGTQDTVGSCVLEGVYCAPTRGAVYLEQDASEPGWINACSSTIVGTSSGGNNSTLTAGHCFDSGRPVRYGTFSLLNPSLPTGANLGDVVARAFGGSSDHEVIRWVTAFGATGRDFLNNCVFVPGVNCQRMNFNAALSDMPVGAEVTQVGQTTHRTIGRVLLNSANVNVGGTMLTDQVVTSACSIPGDSGGAAFIGHRLVGTISAGNFVRDPDGTPRCNPNGPTSVISKATNAFRNLGFSSRLTP